MSYAFVHSNVDLLPLLLLVPALHQLVQEDGLLLFELQLRFLELPIQDAEGLLLLRVDVLELQQVRNALFIIFGRKVEMANEAVPNLLHLPLGLQLLALLHYLEALL